MFGAEEAEQGNDSSERRKASHRAVLEKKLSIAERALANNPCSITLQLERLRICQELWEPSLLAKEWKKLVSAQSSVFGAAQSGCSSSYGLFPLLFEEGQTAAMAPDFSEIRGQKFVDAVLKISWLCSCKVAALTFFHGQ